MLEERRVTEDLTLAQPLIAPTRREPRSRLQYGSWPSPTARRSARSTCRAIPAARASLPCESAQTDWILDNWEQILDGLERDPMALEDRIDWVAKRKIVEQYIRGGRLEWGDDALHSVDLEYHNIDPERSLFLRATRYGPDQADPRRRRHTMAMTTRPKYTRAKGRAELVEQVLAPRREVYLFEWNGVALDRHTYVECPTPSKPTNPPPVGGMRLSLGRVGPRIVPPRRAYKLTSPMHRRSLPTAPHLPGVVCDLIVRLPCPSFPIHDFENSTRCSSFGRSTVGD